MKRVCSVCGAELPDGSNICSVCRAVNTQSSVTKKDNSLKYTILWSVLAFFLALVVIAMVYGIDYLVDKDNANSRQKVDNVIASETTEETKAPTEKPTDPPTEAPTESPTETLEDAKEVVNAAMQALWIDQSAADLISLAHEEVIVTEASYDDMTADEFEAAFQDEIDATFADMDDIDLTITWEIESISDGDLSGYADDYDQYYDLEVTKVKEAIVLQKVSYSYAGQDYESESEATVPVVMIDGKWYLDIENMRI